jgi:hypothetical protein
MLLGNAERQSRKMHSVGLIVFDLDETFVHALTRLCLTQGSTQSDEAQFTVDGKAGCLYAGEAGGHMRWLTPDQTRRVYRVLPPLLVVLLLVNGFQRYRPSLEYLTYRWQGGVANVDGLRIKLAPGWYPYPNSSRRDPGNTQSFVKIRAWWLPSDPRVPYEAILDVSYKPQRNLSQANIERMAVGRKHMPWGELWIVSPQPQAGIEPTMAYALPGGKLAVFFYRPEDLDAIESVTAQ